MLNRFGFIIQVTNSVDDFWDMTGWVRAGLERDSDILFLPNERERLYKVARHSKRVEISDRIIQREANGSSLQSLGGVVRGNGVGERGFNQSMCWHGPEDCGELLPKVPTTWPHSWPQAPHRSWHHHIAASGPSGWTPSHQGQWENVDHRSACGGCLRCQSWRPLSCEYTMQWLYGLWFPK